MPASPTSLPEPAVRAHAVTDRPATRPSRRRHRTHRELNRWSRWLHTWTSMIALAVILFFGVTGITANHPEWTFGQDPGTTQVEGTLPAEAVTADGSVDLLVVSEVLRATEGVDGTLVDHGTGEGTAWISYREPGYSADVTIDLDAGTWTLTTEQQGLAAVLNDLHKGRDAGGSWSWVIDLAGGFLVVVALSGLVLQLVLPRNRRMAMVVAAFGLVVVLVLAALSVW